MSEMERTELYQYWWVYGNNAEYSDFTRGCKGHLISQWYLSYNS